MKAKSTFLGLLSVAAALFIVNACSSKPSEPPAPTTTVEVTTTVQATTTTQTSSCPQPGAGFVKCYDWGSCNGLFQSAVLAIEYFKNDSSALCIDGTVVKGGFGPCAQCFSWKQNLMMSKASQVKWKDVKHLIGTDKSKVLEVGEKVP